MITSVHCHENEHGACDPFRSSCQCRCHTPEPHGLDTAAAGWSWSVPAHDRGDHSACNRNCAHTL